MPQNDNPLDLAPAEDNAPDSGWTTKVEITRVIDADTVEVEVKRTFVVRLSHPAPPGYIFDTPEKNTTLGQKAIEYVNQLLKSFTGKFTLNVNSGKDTPLMDFNSFSRIIGEIWLDNSRLTSILLESGYGRLVKRSKRTTTPWE